MKPLRVLTPILIIFLISFSANAFSGCCLNPRTMPCSFTEDSMACCPATGYEGSPGSPSSKQDCLRNFFFQSTDAGACVSLPESLKDMCRIGCCCIGAGQGEAARVEYRFTSKLLCQGSGGIWGEDLENCGIQICAERLGGEGREVPRSIIPRELTTSIETNTESRGEEGTEEEWTNPPNPQSCSDLGGECRRGLFRGGILALLRILPWCEAGEEALNSVPGCGALQRCCIKSSFPGACRDSDEGLDFGTYGVCRHFNTDGSSEVFRDFCSQDMVTEYYCDGNKCNNTTQQCEYGCNQGKCVQLPSQACYDSDGGENKGVKGTCTDLFGSYEDDCPYGDFRVREWLCEEGRCVTSKGCWKCDYDCRDGACVPPPDAFCEDTDNGIDPSKKGTCTDLKGSFTDYCNKGCGGNNKRITEYYCTSDKECAVANLDCEYYCHEAFGICVGGQSCSDSDGGLDYFTRGRCTDSVSSSDDRCKDSANLYEMHCSLGYCKRTEYKCPNGCDEVKGVCKGTGTSGCRDTDGGIKYYVPGECIDASGSAPDKCKDRNTLYEYYCETGNFCKRKDYTCPNGCEMTKGACR